MKTCALYGSTFHFLYRWNRLKVIPLDSRSRTRNNVHQFETVEAARPATNNSFAWRRRL